MNVQQTVEQLQKTPALYRIQVIELLLQSLKEEIAENESSLVNWRPFQVRTFDLGSNVLPDRDEIYSDRGA